MKFVIKEEKKIIEFIELIKFTKCLSQYTTMMCNEEKMYIQLLDDSMVCLLDINIPREWFETYECERHHTFTMYNNILTKLLGLYSKGSQMEIYVDEEHFNLSYLNDKENKYFTIHLIDLEKEILQTEEIETNLDFTIKTEMLESYLNDLSIYGETIEIHYKENKLYFTSEGDQGKIKIEIFESSLAELNVVDDYEVHSKFSIKYLNYITKLKKVCKDIQIYLDDEKPLHIKINDGIQINYFIAPKTNEE